jgi:anthranilate synthase/aminodeoxychorismate synthase-like glutamine amidotransferase
VAGPLLVLDNYDSFTYNLVQELGELGADPVVHRNDALDLAGVRALEPAAIVISPGPGRPEDAGICLQVIEALAGQVPILGVCLGHQCLAQAFGGEVVRAAEVVHGKTSAIHHDGTGVLAGLPDPFTATRYHSLVVEPGTLPPALRVTATTADGVIMAIEHRQFPLYGVQFHPESVLSPEGPALLANFLRLAGLPVGPVPAPALPALG